MPADMGHGVGQLVLEDGSEAARHPLGRSVSEYFRLENVIVYGLDCVLCINIDGGIERRSKSVAAQKGADLGPTF
jgi:hypothetical protein